MILIIYAHPYPRHSHVNQRLLQAAQELPEVTVRSLYELYPDFNINVPDEQQALESARLVVLQHPLQWYSLPPLLKQWFDKVLVHGWAYGNGGTALAGKDCLWAVTTGGSQEHFMIGDLPGFAVLAQPLQATMMYCGMNWLPYFSTHNTSHCNESEIAVAAQRYQQRLRQYLSNLPSNSSGAKHG